MEEESGARKRAFVHLTFVCGLPTPTWMDGALRQCSRVVSSFFSQSCYTLLSLKILNIQFCPLGQFSNKSIHQEDGGYC